MTHVTCDEADLDSLCSMWEGCYSVWWVLLILTVEPFRGWVTVRPIREWAHSGFLLIIQEKLIKVKGKTLIRTRSCSRNEKCSVPWIFIFTFVFETHISFPLCNAGWEWICGELRIFLSGVCVCVCVCVLLCSSLLFLLQPCILVFGLQEMLRPHESKCASPCVTPPQLENKPHSMKYALWWPLDLGGVQLRVSGVRSRFTVHYGLLHNTTHQAFFRGVLHNFMYVIMLWGEKKTF